MIGIILAALAVGAASAAITWAEAGRTVRHLTRDGDQ